MANEVAVAQPQEQPFVYNPLALMPRSSVEAASFAQQMASSELIPKHLQKKPGDCMMIVMQAHRWRMDPFTVANCTSVVHGRLCYEGKLVAAALMSLGAIEGRLKYDLNGDTITITGTPKGGEPCVITGNVKMWRTYDYKKDREGKRTAEVIPNNWDRDPQSMLVYRGTRQWARLFTPEAILGVVTPDEADDEPAIATVVSQVPIDVPQKAAPPANTQAKPAAAATKPAAQQQAKPAPAQQQQQAQPATAQQTQQPAEQQPVEDADFRDKAPAGDGMPFDPPGAQQTTQPAAPAAGKAPDGSGKPLSETQVRILNARIASAGFTQAECAAAWPAIDTSNLNACFDWLKTNAKTGS